MRKQMIESAALEVATQVRAVEDAIEGALAELAELQGRMVRARATMGVATATGHEAFEQLAVAMKSLVKATATGHEAFEQLAVAMKSLVKARGGMANCHMSLKETTQLVPGLRTVSFGDAQECPPKQAYADLRVVA